jgi:hypothetical protein
LVAAASDRGEARDDRWEGLGSDSAAGSEGKKGGLEVFAWSDGWREGDVEMVVLGSVPAKFSGS